MITLKLIETIVSLCLVNYSAPTQMPTVEFERRQLQCQQEYIKCYERSLRNTPDEKLVDCIKKREIDAKGSNHR